MAMNTLLRQPLLQFLFIGLLLYAGFILWGKESISKPEHITLERASLLKYMQFRMKNFNPIAIDTTFDSLSPETKQQLIYDYVRDEALFREASKLSLAENDFVIRRRLIQKMEYLSQSFVEDGVALHEAEIEQYYASHHQDYLMPATLSFSHVFVASPSSESAGKALISLKQKLNAENTTAQQAAQFGDAFLYQRHYLNSTESLVSGHFGDHFTRAINALPGPSHTWVGPIRSEHGWHLVLLTQRQQAWQPALADIRSRVESDARKYYNQIRTQKIIDAMMTEYTVDGEQALVQQYQYGIAP